MPVRHRSLLCLLTSSSLVLGMAVVLSAPPAVAAANPTPSAGERRGATRLDFTISGTASLSVDVGTGNALFTDQLITLPGVRQAVPITLSYNSSVWGTSTPSAVTGDSGSGWAITGFDQRLAVNSDNSVTYVGPLGLSGVFAPDGSGGYTAPKQFRADLVTTASGWTLTEHASRTTLTFNSSGRLTKVEDRDHNATTFGYDSSGLPAQVQSSRGANPTRTLTVTTAAGRITALAQTDGSSTRSVQLGYSTNGHLASVTDAAGGVTQFQSAYGTDTGQVVTVTNPAGKATTLAYSSGKVSQVNQANPPVDGGAGDAVTRFGYSSSTQTLVADPTTDQSQSVSAVPHTTYDLATDGSQLVAKTTDPNGHARSRTYTALGQVKTDSPAAGGTTTFTYGANNGESLTSIATPGGATGTASYANTGANAFLPSSTTDDTGNAVTYTYDGAGNQLSTAQGAGSQAKVTYNGDGTAATSQSPGAASGVATSYGYDSTTHNLTSITPPSGTGLGTRTYGWDGYGRLYSASDGRGNSTSYTYDGLDRITRVNYSDTATTDVTYSYDKLGHVKTRTDGSGTTSYTYDDLGHLLTVADTAGGGTLSYTYDLAGDVASETDAHGTTTYQYDAAHQLTSITYPKGAGTAQVVFAYDNSGRRTDTWLEPNADKSAWKEHAHTTYDGSGRVTAVKAQYGPATSPTSVVDLTYCYQSGTTPAGSCTASAGTDRSNIQWVKDAVSGEATAYTYDDHARLTKAVITGGSNPRTYTYGYDQAGNRTSASVTGSSPSTQALSDNAANQITSSGYSYDGAGNRTHDATGRDYTFNTAGQLTSSGDSSTRTTYTYAGTDENELVKQATGGGDTYQYAYGRTDQNGLPEIEEATRTDSGGVAAHAYVTHDATGLPVLLTTSTGTVCIYVYDGQDNPVGLLANWSGVAYLYRFDPYGNATVAQNSGGTGLPQNPYVLAGGLQDRTTGLVKYGQRWYDPATGSWNQQDALNAPLDPGDANRYQYAAANPVNNSDPTGGDTEQAVEGVAGAFTIVAGGELLGEAGGIALGVGLGAGLLTGGIGVGIIALGVGISMLSDIF